MATEAVRPDELVEHTTEAALEEKAKLQKHFGRFDIFFFLICTLVGLDTLGAVANDGAQAFTWLAFLGIFFFVPYALLTAELGSTFHEEGGAYIWVKLAFGRFFAVDQRGPLLAVEPDLARRHADDPRGHHVQRLLRRRSTGAWKYLFSLAFIWFAVWAAILSFGIGKWIPTIGAWVRMARARRLHAHRDHLRDLQRRARRRRRRLQADLRDLHRRRPGAVLQLRRLRAAQRGGRRDEGPAEGRAVHGHPRGDRARSCSTACRSWRSCSCSRPRRSRASAASSTP